MKPMTEQTFIDLGFKRKDVTTDGQAFCYYTLDIGNTFLTTNASDEAERIGWECWKATLPDNPLSSEIKDLSELENLVRTLQNNVKENKNA
jgi:hypothetical protein